MSGSVTQWGRRAATLYETGYARKYREHDDQLGRVDAYRAFCAWLQDVCRRFNSPIDVLDLGCGTGRYFSALTNVNRLVGLDASAAMLAEAARPVGADRISARSIELVEGDALTFEFAHESFDFIYAVGVLAEHTPFDARIVSNAARWLRPGGRFAFTTVHPDSASIPRTLSRSIGTSLVPFASGRARGWLRAKLTAGGQYADEALIVDGLGSSFGVETMERQESEAHLHCLCVARKP